MTYTIPEKAAVMLPWVTLDEQIALRKAALIDSRRPDSFKLQTAVAQVTYGSLCEYGFMEADNGEFNQFLSPLGTEVRRLLRALWAEGKVPV